MTQPQTWLQRYQQYCERGESPPLFHIWTAIAGLGAAMGAKCYIDMGGFEWRPNLYVILVAVPGVVQKTHCINSMKGFLRTLPKEAMHLGGQSGSWQGMAEAMGQEGRRKVGDRVYDQCCLGVGELGTFLKPADQDQIMFITDIYDPIPKWSHRLRGTGTSITLVNPFVTLIAGTTPSWIQDNFNKSLIGGGLWSRTLFVYASRKAKLVAHPKLEKSSMTPEERKALTTELTLDLRRISKLEGEFVLTDKAYEWGEQWYEKLHQTTLQGDAADPEAVTSTEREVMQHFRARHQCHVYKTAMILSASEGSSMQITRTHLQKAARLVEGARQNLLAVFGSIGENLPANRTATIMKEIAARGAASRQQLWKSCLHLMSEKEFDEGLNGILSAGYAKQQSNGSALVILATKELKEMLTQSPNQTVDISAQEEPPAPPANEPSSASAGTG